MRTVFLQRISLRGVSEVVRVIKFKTGQMRVG